MEKAKKPLMQFGNKWAWGGFVAGMRTAEWIALLRKNSFDIDPPYWPKACFFSLNSLINSIAYAWERKKCALMPKDIAVPSPVFILGHFRSGTTHLHNLLSLNRTLAYPTTYDALFPSALFTGEAMRRMGMKPFLPEKRFQDSVSVRFDLPQEDEPALAITTGMSPYFGLMFPKRMHHYQQYLSFSNASNSDVERWKDTFLCYAKKLSWKYPGRRLVFKSPPHTARIKQLLDIFPHAQFIYIKRDPVRVIQSMVHLFQVLLNYWKLHAFDEARLFDWVLAIYQEIEVNFHSQKKLIPNGMLCEGNFEDLESDPINQMLQIHERLDLKFDDVYMERLKNYLSSIADYQKNSYPELGSEMMRKLDIL